ncbi:MAG: metal ABC transporter permease [Gammaproteobacteria bacterium]
MIGEFLNSWPLFQNTYLAGWLIAIVLALIGVIVVARDQIFVSAAVAQASSFGVALGMWTASLAGIQAWAWLHTDGFLSGCAIAFAVASALLTARTREPRRESSEAITGWIFLTAGSGAVLLLAHSPHGLEEVHRLLASSLIGATEADVAGFMVLTVASVIFFCLGWRRILFIALDPMTARALGIHPARWLIATSLALGLAAGLAIRTSGMLYTFGCLVLPGLVAKNLCREVRAMFVVAPLVALAAAVGGFVIAHHADYPPGQMTVAILCLVLIPAWLYRAAVARFCHLKY